MELTIDHTPELLLPPRPNLYPSGQSVPLLEATCVDDEVYDAVRVSDDHGWSRRTQKYMMLGLVSIGFLATAAITGVTVVSMGSQNEGSNGIDTPRPSPSLSPTLFITENNVSEKLTAC